MRDTERLVEQQLTAALRRSDSGVDSLAEALFDKLFAMLPKTHWEETRIVVGDLAVISAPYRKQNVSAKPGASSGATAVAGGGDKRTEGLERVRSMVAAFWNKRE